MLTDSRSKVRRKAGRVLGVLHAEVDQTDLNNLVAMFKASDPQEVMDAPEVAPRPGRAKHPAGDFAAA